MDIADQIRANSIARANGMDGAVLIDGEYRPYKGPTPEQKLAEWDAMTEWERDEFLREEYPDWG